MKYVTLDDSNYASLKAALDAATTTPPGEEVPPVEPPEEPPTTPTGGDCGGSGDCQYLNTKCVTSGFWKGWCVDSLDNFKGTSTEGQMTHNANCLRRPPRLDKRTIKFRWDSKFDNTWLTNPIAGGQHLGGLWAASGTGRTRKEWVTRNVRVDFSRQSTDGFDCVVQGYKNTTGTEDLNLVMDVRLNARVPGAYVANQWRTTIVTATYDPTVGRVFGTVEYVGVGIKGFNHIDADAKDFNVFWNWYGYGNVDTSTAAPRADFGLTVRNINVECL